MTKADSLNYKRINLKRKVFAKGKQNFKRFKKTPKYVKDNVENQVAREKDAYHFTDSEDEQDDLGMGLDISDLPFLDDNTEKKQKEMIALTQDSVRPLFANNATFDEAKLIEGLNELRYSSFRPNQKEAIKRILFGRSTLFISPTGSGKSLCYQLPALLYWRYRKYITIVISPLISLMEDQMSNFPSSLKAISLHSGHTRPARRRSIEQLINGEAQVAFISPEAIVGGILSLEDLRNLPPVGFVCIDEAHCLSEWSHNFRPAYQQFFSILHDKLSIKTYLGLTATATKATSNAIARSLNINPEIDILGSTMIPENLILSVSYEKNKVKALIELLKSPTFRIMPSIIVYCNRREETENVASAIRTGMQNYTTMIEVPERRKSDPDNVSVTSNENNTSSPQDKGTMKLTWHAESYHAGLSTECRKRIQRQFIKGEIRVVVATIAFGMGINKANIRAIIHYDMPSSFESYVQEIGRAGRDGKPAQCHMFLKSDKTDLFYQQRNIYSSITGQEYLKTLVDNVFQPCKCGKTLLPDEIEEVNQKNLQDKHTIPEIDFCLKNGNDEKENCPDRVSVVRKHRNCGGHEVTFDLDKAVEDINIKVESIITLICQIEKAYPQLQVKQYPPIKSICNLFCYRGAAQLVALIKSSPAVRLGRIQSKGIGVKAETKDDENKISFDVVKVASTLGTPSADVIRMLKKTEWELVDSTGRFRRSQIKVNFVGNSIHLQAVGDLNEEESKEIIKYLFEFTKKYEYMERARMERVYHTFKDHSMDVAEMKDKIKRLHSSLKLKTALNNYFNSSAEIDLPTVPESEKPKVSKQQEDAIRNHTKSFISHNGKDFNPRAIARIFQGVSTPRYPAEYWGMNKLWWRTHLDVDFLQLTAIIQDQLFNEPKPKPV